MSINLKQKSIRLSRVPLPVRRTRKNNTSPLTSAYHDSVHGKNQMRNTLNPGFEASSTHQLDQKVLKTVQEIMNEVDAGFRVSATTHSDLVPFTEDMTPNKLQISRRRKLFWIRCSLFLLIIGIIVVIIIVIKSSSLSSVASNQNQPANSTFSPTITSTPSPSLTLLNTNEQKIVCALFCFI